MWSNTKVTSRHVLKFGGEARVLRVFNNETNNPAGNFSFGRDMTQGPAATAPSQTAGDGLASFLLGLGSGSFTKNYETSERARSTLGRTSPTTGRSRRGSR